MYIYQQHSWPHFTWDQEAVSPLLLRVRHLQGRIIGRMENLGFRLKEEALLQTLTLDVLKSTEIEGENLNSDEVRSSIARHLGLEIAGLVPSDRNVDGVVEMILDATQNYKETLLKERLFDWHNSLFPENKSGLYKIKTGAWRDNALGPMQVVSGAMGRERVHFEAPEASVLEVEMNKFFDWFNEKTSIDPVLKAAIAHLWFVTIHPFDDGNGRIARAIADMQLARADESNQRFYSMSAQIRQERNTYYSMLESTQKGNLDITTWIEWFLSCIHRALEAANVTLAKVLIKANFWQSHASTVLNSRQQLVINKLLDGFEGKLTSSKWARITKCSQDTAGRDIHDLIHKNILIKDPAGGRSTSYFLNTLSER